MQYKLVSDNPAQQSALESNPSVKPLLDPFLPVLQARSIMAACKMGVFDALNRKECTVEELAQNLSLDASTLSMMLRILVCAGYLQCNGQEFSLTEISRMALLPSSPTRLSNWVRFNYVHWEIINMMEEVLRTGKGFDPQQFLKHKSDWAIQQQAMLETARPAAPWVAANVPVKKGARRMLDIGGSHGLYGALICRRHPPMQSEVLELPDAVEHAQELARLEGINDVVSHRIGSILTEELDDESFDTVFLGNIIHHFTIDQNQTLLRKLRASLKNDGTVAIWDFRYPERDAKPDLVNDGFALLFRISSSAQCYTIKEIAGWVEAAGFIDVMVHQGPMPTHMLITGRIA